MKKRNDRIICADGVSLSVQASQYAYCWPRIDELGSWENYSAVEVGFIDIDPPETWREYSDGEFPSTVYGYVPTSLVNDFIESHGGRK